MIEDIVRHIKALLQAQLPGKLDEIEMERGDGVALEDVQSFHTWPRQRDGRQKYPAIAVWGDVTVATNTISRRKELRHRIPIWIHLREVSPDTEFLQSKLWRYVEAVERVLASDPTLGGMVVDSVVVKHGYAIAGEDFNGMASLTLEALERPSVNNY